MVQASRSLALQLVLTVSCTLPAQESKVEAVAAKAKGTRLRVLLIDGHNNHKWQQTSPVLERILENSGRFDVRVATAARDISTFKPSFANVDVVVSNYNGPLWPKATREGFARFVRDGGGAVIVHAADNAFPEWKEYNEIIGLGGWGRRSERHGPYVRWRDGKIVRDTSKGRGGSHGRRHEFELIARQPTHPILRGLPARWLHARDELYDRLRGPAKNLEVLATAFSAKETRGSGEHEPILMTIAHGKGRVFHTTLGHDVEAMQGLGFQITLLRGSEWAATGRVSIASFDAKALSSEKAMTRKPEDVPRAWQGLFDGDSLAGWTRRNGHAEFAIKDGVITGTTSKGSPNSFLCSNRIYGDFELRFEVKVDKRLNSGVQIRSATRDGLQGRVHGPQVEIASNGNAGWIFGEALGTGWLSPSRKGREKRAAFKKDAWNRYRVVAKGERIQTWINGVQIADLVDQKSKMPRGFIGLQVHSIPRKQGPFTVQWRELYLRELD